ncbi:MAG: O-antigen ligase family protein [bacterium]|nr:O-antigen ligase family protein [bacterium]
MNFLKAKSRTGIIWFILAVLATALAAVVLPPLWSISLAVFLILVVFFTRHLVLGMLILVFLFPYTGLRVDLSGVQALRNIPFLNQLNAPLADVFAVILFLAWLVTLIKSLSASPFQKGGLRPASPSLGGGILGEFSHWKSFLVFFLSGAVSLLNVSSQYFWSSVKYLTRVVLFFYAAFFVPIISIMRQEGKNTEEEGVPSILTKVLKVMYWTGLLSALMGLVSFFVVPAVGFPRATPFSIFGFTPLGVNHNLLAETLVATAPAGFFLWWLGKDRAPTPIGIGVGALSGPNWFFAGSLLQVVIALLTFARTAWIALAIQFCLFIIFWFRLPRPGGAERGGRAKEFFQRVWPFLFFVAPLLVIFIWTTGAQIVQESTLARLDMARISWFYFWQTPLIGQGIGTFVNSLWGIRAFLLDYGEPLEAHGVVWKLLFEQGLFGLLSFIFFIGMILWTIYLEMKEGGRIAKAVATMAMVMATGVLAYELFNTTYYTSKLWVPLAVAAGAVSLLKSEKLKV